MIGTKLTRGAKVIIKGSTELRAIIAEATGNNVRTVSQWLAEKKWEKFERVAIIKIISDYAQVPLEHLLED